MLISYLRFFSEIEVIIVPIRIYAADWTVSTFPYSFTLPAKFYAVFQQY